MKQRPRIYYSETDKALMWDRWQKGESLNSIARHFDRHHSAHPGHSFQDRRHSSAGETTLRAGIDTGGTRRDLSGRGRGPVDPFDRSITGPSAFNSQS